MVEIVNLVDNHVTAPGLMAEHGLSFLVRVADQNILFDTGAGAVIGNNMRKQGINPGAVTAVVLSHGHFDHAGGLKEVCQYTGPIPVYCHPGVFGAKYKLEPGKEPRYVGISWSQQELEQKGVDFHFNRTAVKLAENVLLTGEIPRKHELEKEASNFYIFNNGEYIPDDLADDQSLVISTPKGLVVVLGCTHSGLLNTLDHILAITGAERIYAMTGGTHLKEASPERMKKTIEALPRYGLQLAVGCHCTGFEGSMALAQVFGDKFSYNHIGKVIRIE